MFPVEALGDPTCEEAAKVESSFRDFSEVPQLDDAVVIGGSGRSVFLWVPGKKPKFVHYAYDDELQAYADLAAMLEDV